MRVACFLVFMFVFIFFIGCDNSSKSVSDDVNSPDDDVAADSFDSVTVSQGAVKGTAEGGVISYKGIPFAEPPLGNLRWKAPVEKGAWDGVLDASAYSKSCPQSLAVSLGYVMDWSEDCLYLNVFRPDSAIKDLPVMVFIHGGGYVNGGAALPTYEGLWLASQGVVLVTLNYRLGEMGFLSVPNTDISGNYGTMDQIAALEWVRKNISAFGGNSANVTVFGESAGAMSVGNLIALRPDLFERAIIESGTIVWGDSMSKDAADSQGTRFAEAAGCSDAEDVAACLRGKSASDVLSYLPSGMFDSTKESYGPYVDGSFFKDIPYKLAIAGEGKNVPLLIGTNEDEGSAFTYAYKSYLQTEDNYNSVVNQQFGAAASKVLEEYPASAYESPWHAYSDLFGDIYFNCASILMVRDFVKYNSNVRYYRFSHVPAYGESMGLGCFHGAELGYLFNTWNNGYKDSESGYDETVSNITSLWVKFAADGKLDDWPFYGFDENYLDISETLNVGQALEKDNCDFWNQFSM